MQEESAFLRKLLDNPADDTTRLVYADWLDEQGDDVSRAKSQFLRLTVRLLDPKRKKHEDKELQQLAAGLDTDWLAVVSRLKVEGCKIEAGKEQLKRGPRYIRDLFTFVCDKRWDELLTKTTDNDPAIRFCDQCGEGVHYCDSIVTARDHARKGHCIAVDLGIIRHEGDVSQMQMLMLGRPSAESLERERKRNSVDAVSEAREKAKREKQRDDCGD